MMMMMCKRLAQVPMLCVPIYNMKLAMMQKTPIFITFSAHTKMAADKRGQIEVFARMFTIPSHGRCPIGGTKVRYMGPLYIFLYGFIRKVIVLTWI